MPDAQIIPMPGAGEPSEGSSGASLGEALSPSKAARLVGNTGPQPTGAASGARRSSSSSRTRPFDLPIDLPIDLPFDIEALGDLLPDDLGEKAQALWAFLQQRMAGDYAIDEFGFDPELTDTVLMALVRPLYRSWFRVEASGLENIPDVGGALVVANHSGTVAFDAVMTQVALLDDHPARRHLRMLGANLVFQTPFLGELARKAGHTLACNPDAERLLSNGEIVGVWPEGFKGIGKPFSDRYKLQRFGRGGFVAAALRTRTPIIPTAIVGAEEIYPMIGNAKTAARLLGLPYFPITPTFPWLGPLGLVPLPSKWFIHFGEPIHTEDYPEGAADDPMLVFNLTDQVREQIQQSLYRLLMKRPSVFG